MFGRIGARKERQQRKENENFEKNKFNDFDQYDARVQKEASRLRSESDAAKAAGKKEAEEMFANPPQGLTNDQRDNMRNQQQQQVNRDIQNYNRMLQGQQSTRGVRGGVTAAQQANLARMGQESMTDFERGLNDLEAQMSMKKLAAQYGIMQGNAGENALLNQQAYDKIFGYLQNQNQKRLSDRADKFFY